MKLRACLVSALLTAGVVQLAPAQAGPQQLPVGPGGLATPNVTHLLNIPTGVGVGGGFIGSTYFQTSADPVWFRGTGSHGLTGGGLLAFDATDPEAPRLTGALPIPHQQNEDVSLSVRRKLLVISSQPARTVPLVARTPCQAGRLFLVDVSVPSAMRLAGPPLLLPAQVGTAADDGRSLCGPGHTATLVDSDNYLWVAGSRDGRVYVVDVRDVTMPRVVGSFATPAGADGTNYKPGVVHDADVDRFGDVWVAGSGGTAVYRLTKDPLKPALVASMTTNDARAANQLIHHGTQRLDRDHVLVTEEDYQERCDSNNPVNQDGSLQSWRIDRRAKRLVPLASWDAPRNADQSGPLSTMCSSHWFTINTHKVVADAWYGAGVRFLDVSNPRKLRSIGTWRGDSAVAGQARFVPGRPDLVYVADYSRGLDVIRIANGGRGARTVTPRDEKPVEGVPAVGVPGLRIPVKLRPHEHFGWSCAVPSPI